MNPALLTRQVPLLYALLVALALGILSLAGCGDRPGTVEGTVRDEESQEAVDQAKVVVFALETLDSSDSLNIYGKRSALQEQVTDESGEFSFSLEPGNYVIKVWVEDLEVGNRMIQVKPGRRTAADFMIKVPLP